MSEKTDPMTIPSPSAQQAPSGFEYPADTPLKAAIRCAFDHPTLANIQAVAEVAALPDQGPARPPTGEEELTTDAAIYLSDLAHDHAAQVAAGSETVEYALRTVAVLGFAVAKARLRQVEQERDDLDRANKCVVDELTKESTRAESAEQTLTAVRGYVQHKPGCRFPDYGGWCVCHGEQSNNVEPNCPRKVRCTCGLDALLASRPAGAETPKP